MKFLRCTLFSLSFLTLPLMAHAAGVCPSLTGASGAYYAGISAAGSNCNVLITVNADLSNTVTILNVNPYDGNDDNYVGIVNNSATAFSTIALSSATDIFGFDGDGIDEFGIAGNSTDTTQFGAYAYGGPDAYFTGIDATKTSGTVNFIGGIASGGSGYFSLEEAPTATPLMTGPVGGTVTPEPSSLILLGTGALGLAGAVRRRFNR